MQHDWYTGATILVRYDDDQQAVVILARNGKAPPLALPAGAFVTATAQGARLELTGAFGDDTKIALRLATAADAAAIARILGEQLALPRQPQRITLERLPTTPDGTFVTIEGRCFPFANGPVMENQLALTGVAIRIEHNAPYRATGFLQQSPAPQLRVLAIEHLNPPVTWLAGETIRVIYAPERDLIGIVPQPGHPFAEPAGTLELWLPRDTLVQVWLEATDRLVCEGDLSRTNYGTRVTVGPVSAADARAIFLLLDEHLQLPRTPAPMTPAQAAALETMAFVQIEGTCRRGHFEGPNFDGAIKVQHALEPDRRYRVTGFLYPRMQPDDAYLGYTGPRITPITVEALA